MSPPPSLYELDRLRFAELCGEQPRYRVDQIWRGLYDELLPLKEITTIPKTLRTMIAQSAPPALDLVEELSTDNEETIKWLWGLADGRQIETVLMRYPKRSTVCVSSQAGCAMACGFCATGQSGFDRNLSTGEIVEQVVIAARRARTRRVSNVVFMGMGEPLANFDNTWNAIERIHHDIGLSARSITVSTVGVVPGIYRLASASLPVTLAVSLHAGNDELRDEIVPLNRRYSIDELCEAMIDYRSAKGRRVSLEWAMIDGVNDSDRDAVELARIGRRVRAHINLIPLNPTPGYLVRGTPSARIIEFRDRLTDLRANATIRQTRGLDIDAACGQLSARSLKTDALPDGPTRATPVKIEQQPRT